MEAERAMAEWACGAAGVQEAWLDICVIGVAATSDTSFIDAFEVRVPPPLTVQPHKTESTEHIILFSSAVLETGTFVDSYTAHFNPVGSTLATLDATLVFDAPVLGVIVTTAHVTGSDSVLGHPDVTYGAGPNTGLELNSGDKVELSSDRRSVILRLRAQTSIDRVRVLVEGGGPRPTAETPSTTVP